MADTIGEKNPLRYRGYYYDAETGFYYLLTRYYDAEICRFLNADGYVSTGQDVLGFNMFAYCGNNPVVRKDVSGMRHEISAGPINGFNKHKYDVAEGFSNALAIVQNGTDFALALGKYAYQNEEAPPNIGEGVFEKNMQKKIKQIDNAMDIAEKVGDTLSYVAVGIEVCENAYINVEQGESTKKIVWDMTVDTVISGMNTYVSIKAGAAIGTTICPGLGTVGGAIAGAVLGWGLDMVLDSLSYEPRRYFKSWVN